MSGAEVELHDVHLDYGNCEALRGVSLRIEAGTICGLLGRNGSGKSSLLSLLASYQPPTSGRVLVDGGDPFEDADRMAEVVLVGAEGSGSTAYRVGDALDLAAALRPTWDRDYADHLVARFAVPRKTTISKLSKGTRAAVGAVVGLASRTPLTLFDEVHAGMDVPTRYAFYEELLADVVAHPRTVVLSTHNIDEVASLFGTVAILEEGRLLVHDDADTLRLRGCEATGPADAVDRFAAGRTVLASRDLGRTRATVVWGDVDEGDRQAAAATGVDLGPLPLQDLFVHLTARSPQEVDS